MRSELFRIPLELAGVPLFGAGLLLALLAIGVGVYAWWARRRWGAEADLPGLFIPAAVAAAGVVLVPRLAPLGVPVRAYGLLLVAAIGVGLAMAVHRARERGVDADTILSLAMWWLFLPGIVGARLFFVIEYWEVRFAPLPLGQAIVEAFRFTEGGLVVYGSLIGATLGFLAFTYRQKLPPLALADILAPSLVAGLAIGRLGCLMNGCCFGGACDLPWAITFPPASPPFEDQLTRGQLHGVRLTQGGADAGVVVTDPPEHAGDRVVAINGYGTPSLYDAGAVLRAAYADEQPVTVRLADDERLKLPAAARSRSQPVHPTQIYSALHAALLAWLLWEWYPHRRRDGAVALLLLTLYPIGRFLLEMIRIDEANFLGTGLSISQNLSVVLLASAVLGWAWLLRSQRPLWAGLGAAGASNAGTSPAEAA
ncbi:MAG: prolipoprotein diacylglyceryl transferase [Planctomycetota bacterium]